MRAATIQARITNIYAFLYEFDCEAGEHSRRRCERPAVKYTWVKDFGHGITVSCGRGRSFRVDESAFSKRYVTLNFAREGAPDAHAMFFEWNTPAYPFACSTASADKISRDMRGGIVGINMVGFGLPETPVCGINDSGCGHEGCTEGMAEYQVTKFVMQAAL